MMRSKIIILLGVVTTKTSPSRYRLAAFSSPFAHLGAVVAHVGAKTGVSVTRHLGFTDYLYSRLVEAASIETKRVRHWLQLHDRCTGHDDLLI